MVLISCKNCKKVYKKENYDSFLCNRCNHMVKKRVENSLQISLALTICAMLLYIPAMVYPMMVVTQFGVNLENKGDGKGQQYNTPEYVFKNLHTDFMIVGRGIYKSEDAEKSALNYKIAGWNAYKNSL